MFDVTIACQPLGELFAEHRIAKLVAHEWGQQIPLLHALRLVFVIAEIKKNREMVRLDNGNRLRIHMRAMTRGLVKFNILLILAVSFSLSHSHCANGFKSIAQWASSRSFIKMIQQSISTLFHSVIFARQLGNIFCNPKHSDDARENFWTSNFGKENKSPPKKSLSLLLSCLVALYANET